MSVIRRDDTYYLKKRVPVRYASVEQRKLIWITLKTDSEKAAKTKAGAVWNEVVGSWEALINGIIDDAEVQYTAAKQIAVSRGYRFMSAERVAALPTDELMDRIDAATKPDGKGPTMKSLEVAKDLTATR